MNQFVQQQQQQQINETKISFEYKILVFFPMHKNFV